MLAGTAAPGAAKPLRGVFVIMATPYTRGGEAVDFEDLAREVEFLDRCGVHGMVWPQMASEYSMLTRDERLRGMEVIARAARGRKPALVLGVQDADLDGAMAYLRHAEKLAPDAVIAMPPTRGTSLNDYRQYFSALARATARPLFVQTTGGAKGMAIPPAFLVELAREFPNCGYVKEEMRPAIPRMKELARNRPPIRAIFSGGGGRAMLYEARLEFDGTMPGAAYADIHAQVWDLWHTGRRENARELFARLLLMMELEQHIPGTRQYIMRKRGVFKTIASRQKAATFGPPETAEIDFQFEALRPFLRAS